MHENNSPPSVVAVRLPMTVSFRTRTIDLWYYFSQLAIRTITGRCLLILFLIVPFVGPSVALYHTMPGSKMEHTMMLLFWPGVGVTYLVFLFSGVIGIVLGAAITPVTTITIDPQLCLVKSLMSQKIPWKRFSSLTEEADYFYFFGWRIAFHVPKWAFSSRAEAKAFFDTALEYWHEAKGTTPSPIPAIPGVWPPAPTVGRRGSDA